MANDDDRSPIGKFIESAAPDFANLNRSEPIVVLPEPPESDRIQRLRSFSPEFVNHNILETDFVDYYKHHENVKEWWKKERGTLFSASYGEIPHFWSKRELFVRYEAELIRFIKAGIDIRRIFVFGWEFCDAGSKILLYKTLKRHQALRFDPHILGFLDLASPIKKLGIDCDMFGVVNRKVGYFFRFPTAENPIMLRTINKKITRKADNMLCKMYEDSIPFAKWSTGLNMRLPKKVESDMRNEIETIEMMAAQKH